MIEPRIQVEGFDRIIFRRAELKRALRKGGAIVRSEARRLIARRAISAPGELPGRDTGAMSRSIKTKVGAGGGYVVVSPYRTPEMGNDYYPAYLIYGTSRGLRPRKDFMQVSLQNKQQQIRSEIANALRNALETA